MKRAAELRGLSDDHHQGLVQARRLRRPSLGEAGNPAEAAAAFLDFWRKDTSVHFRKEEEVLLPVFARHGGDPVREPLGEMLAQHTRIRSLVMELGDQVADGEVRPETLQSIGELLETHIRLEERQVFPLIEETLTAEALKEVASRLTVAEAGPKAEPWVPARGLSYDPWSGPGDSEGGG
jgi:hemerythrin-like domain-containing protein